MSKKRRKNVKPRVPEVLWRIFHNRARTLSDTLLSLLPTPNIRLCSCSSASSCLACSTHPLSFLIKPADPKPYCKLMNECFVVVSDSAPPLHDNWAANCLFTPLQLVRKTIERMLNEGQSSNLLCNGYDKVTLSSTIVELLTSSAWVILHARVGDIVMQYLLRHCLIFLPDSLNCHFQVSGMSIGKLNLKIIEGNRRRQDEDQILLGCGPRACKKRKQCDNADSHLGRQLNSNGECPETSREGSVLCEVSTFKNFKLDSSEGITKSKKHSRQRRWHRQKKPRQRNFIGVDSNNVDAKSDSTWAPMECCCFFMFQAHMKITDKTLIDRQPMFHRADRSLALFPRNHILNKLKPSLYDANQLMGEIFGAFSRPDGNQKHDSHTCSVDFSCLNQSLMKKMKALIRRARNCKYLQLLNKHCPVQTVNPNMTKEYNSTFEIAGSFDSEKCLDPYLSGGTEVLHEKQNLSQIYCSKHQVASFIWAVCRSVIPQELLGTSANWRSMRRNISIFIGLRRFEKFSLKQCMHKLKVTAFHLFSDETTSTHMNDQSLSRMKGMQVNAGNIGYKITVRMLQCWVYWLMTNFIIPIVQCNFYVTTTQHGNQDIFYYRKSVWDKLTKRAMSDLMNQTLLHLNVDSARDAVRKRNFGFSKLRFLPKDNGVRVIANLSTCSRIPKQVCMQNKLFTGHQNVRPYFQKRKFQYLKSVNSVVRDLHVIFDGVRSSEPAKLGASVFDYNDVYKILCPFLISLKESGVTPCAYIVVTDVAKAFDSINQDKLLLVMRNVIEKDMYQLKKTDAVICTKKSMWFHENFMAKNQTISSCFSLQRPSVPYKLLHSVLVNKESSCHLQRKDLLRCLAEHVYGNILHLDGAFYLQKIGIAQGSILSSLLCSFYFANLEKKVIYPYLEKAYEASNDITLVPCTDGYAQLGNGKTCLHYPKYVLMRFIDDMILITTSRKQAISYCARLQRGFRDYNCYINNEKLGLSFKCDDIPYGSNNRLLVGDDGQSFISWSGLLINCRNLEIQADYGRYLQNHLSSTLTINWHNKPYQHFEQKIRAFIRPKCHPILFDQNINSETVARLNVYQIFLLAAMKFHCYVHGLSRFRKPQPDFSSMVINSIRYLYKLIKRHMRQLSSSSGISPLLTLNKREIEWLGITAFIRALNRKQSCHKHLLSILGSKLSTHSLSDNVPLELKNAVDDSHSSIFWKIKY